MLSYFPYFVILLVLVVVLVLDFRLAAPPKVPSGRRDLLEHAVRVRIRHPVFLGIERLIEHRWGYVTGVLFEKSSWHGHPYPCVPPLVLVLVVVLVLDCCLSQRRSRSRPADEDLLELEHAVWA